jgi:radical SAM superfamily enzyme YgiQ (UPF0313 family)
MSKKVLLVYPGVHTNFFAEIPLSLIYVAWALKKSGYSPEIFDMRIDDYKSIKQFDDYLFVGITSMTGGMIREGVRFAEHAKALCPSIPVVWGGVHVSLTPEQSLHSSSVDIIVRGEGELTVQELAKALEENIPLDNIKGLSFKKNGVITHNLDREYMDMNTIDIELPYELLKLERYSLASFPIHTSRGCPYRCAFCYNICFNKRKWRYKSASRVLEEIDYVIKKFGSHTLTFFSEDEFFISVPRVKEICQGIIEKKYNITWESFCRFNSFQNVDEEMLTIIEKSGCKSLGFGAESGSQRVLDDIIQKDITIDMMISATEKLKKTGIVQILSFMSGLPEETDADMAKTFDLIDKLSDINPHLYINGIVMYTPYPGTPLFDKIIKKYNYRIPETLEKWANYKIYRSIGATWLTKKYANKYRAVSILTRFPFWKKKFALSDINTVIEGKRFTRFPFNIFYWLMTNLAIKRFRSRNFSFPVEWTILEKVLESIRGYV